MPPDPHAPAPLWVSGLADIPDGGDGYKPRQPERRPHPAAGTQLGELVAPARRAHETVQGVGHHPNDCARTKNGAEIVVHVTAQTLSCSCDID